MSAFVIVHGAWGGGWEWTPVARLLRTSGHDVVTPTLTGLGERAHLMSKDIRLATHVTDVVNHMKWEGLDGVVLCGHSYGGMVVSGVAEQMAGKIASIVFLDAFVPDNGEALSDLTGAATLDLLRAAQAKGDIGIPARTAASFNVNEKDRAWVDAMCVPQPIATFLDKMTLTGARAHRQEELHPRAEQRQSGLRQGDGAGQGRSVVAHL